MGCHTSWSSAKEGPLEALQIADHFTQAPLKDVEPKSHGIGIVCNIICDENGEKHTYVVCHAQTGIGRECL